MAYYRKLEGELVYLSPMNPDDAPIYTKWLADPSLSRPLGNIDLLFSEPGERKYMEKLAEERGEYHFAVVRASSDVLLGNISLFDIHNTHRTATTGLFIGDAGGRGKGFGTEALKLLLGYAFKELNLRSVGLNVHADNPAALRCYEKAGFKEYGRRREAVYHDGRYVDMIYMDILAREFED